MADRESASEASSKVQEVAANMQQAAATRKRITGSKADAIARRYFAAIDAHDIAEVISLWAPGGRQRVHGQLDAPAPEGVHASVGELIGAIPDLHMQVLSTIAAGERCGVHWRLTGTFAGPGTIGGVAPTGRPVELEGFDLLGISDGLIRQNDVFVDSMTVAPQYRSQQNQGPGGLSAIYYSELPLSRSGVTDVLALTRVGNKLIGSTGELAVALSIPIPAPGHRPPDIATDTLATTHGSVALLTTRVPPEDMHSVSFNQVLGKKPVALLLEEVSEQPAPMVKVSSSPEPAQAATRTFPECAKPMP